jgi:hypothetical protein
MTGGCPATAFEGAIRHPPTVKGAEVCPRRDLRYAAVFFLGDF